MRPRTPNIAQALRRRDRSAEDGRQHFDSDIPQTSSQYEDEHRWWKRRRRRRDADRRDNADDGDDHRGEPSPPLGFIYSKPVCTSTPQRNPRDNEQEEARNWKQEEKRRHNSRRSRHSNFIFQQRVNASEKCTIWSDAEIPELCSAGTQSRLRMLRHIYLFPELQPLSLIDLFGGWKDDNGKWQLQTGEKGNDCIAGSINRCTTCFQRLSGILRKLDEAFKSFDVTLSRFDCLPAVDTASATRPFSPNATCENCKIWYRRWLLVQSLQIWKRPPCVNWCYYTQLACPHLAPAKLWDYAGHPSFQCRDMDIDSWRQECDCVHPCDVKGVVDTIVTGNAPSFRHDFFAAQVHCETRKKECHTRSTAHDRRLSASLSNEDEDEYEQTTSTSFGYTGWGSPQRLLTFFLILLLML
ncbi:unnamed protein product [Caenorhabditis bovis]|uniref:Uncharacterized protein n=1 Tax=Caenorhabditis bovis TaxID=2654633 RepID=A0A8S1EBF6_9PELO|nr:unnamed protein product [Caenorhabditis bovis]